jgi:hypothetical protein
LHTRRSTLAIEAGEVRAAELPRVILTVTVIIDVVTELAHGWSTDPAGVNGPLLSATIAVIIEAVTDLRERRAAARADELPRVALVDARGAGSHIVTAGATDLSDLLIDEAITVFIEPITEL